MSRIPKRQAQLRALVWRRDRGKCALCGWDTEKLREVLAHAEAHYRTLVPREGRYLDGSTASFLGGVLTDMGLPAGRKELWDADHILPLILGGADTLKNLRTLCIPCHRTATDGTLAQAAKAARLQHKAPRKAAVRWRS